MLFSPAEQVRDSALRVPFIDDFKSLSGSGGSEKSSKLKFWLASIAWVLLIFSAARPQWIGEAVDIPVSGRDLMMAVDLSLSMEQEDFQLNGQLINRLQASKVVAGNFIERRVGDRIGLILFGERAYLQTPLTFDRKTVRTLLDESALGLAGKSTAIGDAIGLAVKRLREVEEEVEEIDKVLILLTDGANTAGVIEPLHAAELAAREGLKIYTIGIGADEMIVRSLFGSRRVNPSRDLDEKTLTAIAEKTGGKYFRARDTQELTKIYSILDELEPVEHDPEQFRPKKALFHWTAGSALLLAIVVLLL
ncbi:MAG: VWA domain-containing protein [Gammaproteobacteria bacterium]